jgi:hypothetical protein
VPVETTKRWRQEESINNKVNVVEENKVMDCNKHIEGEKQ